MIYKISEKQHKVLFFFTEILNTNYHYNKQENIKYHTTVTKHLTFFV